MAIRSYHSIKDIEMGSIIVGLKSLKRPRTHLVSLKTLAEMMTGLDLWAYFENFFEQCIILYRRHQCYLVQLFAQLLIYILHTLHLRKKNIKAVLKINNGLEHRKWHLPCDSICVVCVWCFARSMLLFSSILLIGVW